MGIAAHHPAYKSVTRVAAVTAFLLLVPLVAMLFTDEVSWTTSDFVVAGVLLFGAGITYELIALKTRGVAYRAAIGLAVGASLLLIWANLAVGLIGSEANPANLMYAGVLGIEIVGVLIARLKARGMALALSVTAVAQVLVGVIALAAGFGAQENGVLDILLINGFFATLFAISAALFHRASRASLRNPA